MAENVGKPGGLGQGGDDVRAEPPGAIREVSRPPPLRRDPRADPDDDEPNNMARVDVVAVERGGDRGAGSVDTLTNAALTLRRELAKLHQQAAAVERTIEDQRRERSDALERVDAANARADDLTQKLELAEAEVTTVRRLHESTLDDLQKVRAERDDLARAIEYAKTTAEDLARAREEAETLREAHDEALRAASKYEAELAEIRKREQAEAQKRSDGEAAAASLRERLERTTAELGEARLEASQGKSEITRLKQELESATDAGRKAKEEADRERATMAERVERLEKSLAEARASEEKLAAAESELAAARRETSEAKSDNARLERDLEGARHTRDVNIERATMAERETQGVRQEAERLQRELESATIAISRAEGRAASADRARIAVEDSVRQLRDEVTSAFARWRTISPSVPPPGMSSAPPTRAVPLSFEETPEGAERSPATRRGASTSFPPVAAEAPPLGMARASGDGETAGDGRSHAARSPADPPDSDSPPEDGWSSPPPPMPSSKPPSRKSLPPLPAPLLDESIAELDPADLVPGSTAPSPNSRSVPPPIPGRPVPPPSPPARRVSVPPAVYPSVPPLGVGTPVPPVGASSPQESRDPSSIRIHSPERDELLERLAEPDTARTAAIALREHPDWLRGRPPVMLLAALTALDYDVEAPIFEVARLWERESICRALIATMRDEPDQKLREHGAWLLKHLGSPTALASLVELVKNESEPPAVRRWLIEAIERLVASRAIGWNEVRDLVTQFVEHPDPSLRDGVIGILASLERSDEKRKLLLELLRTDDDEVVLASAVHALTGVLPVELDPAIAERLLGHPSPRVQRSVVEFIDRSKRAPRS